MGYVRSDHVTTIVYRGDDGHVHELAYGNGRWTDADLYAHAIFKDAKVGISGTSLGGPFGYVRSDNVSVVVYLGSDRHVHELSLQAGAWYDYDLSKHAGSTKPISRFTAV